jgi:hypothetical protein
MSIVLPDPGPPSKALVEPPEEGRLERTVAALNARAIKAEIARDAWIGRWISRSFGYAPSRRSMLACAAWLEPFSTIKKTLCADAYGSLFTIRSTSRPTARSPSSARHGRRGWRGGRLGR